MISQFKGKYFFLSNFYPCGVTVSGITYQSTEAAYQASKTVDIDERLKFTSVTAKQSKHMGYKITLRADWHVAKLETMELILRAKFMQHPDLAQDLLDTGDQELIEGNYLGDVYWGVCKGKGQNKLGKLLMLIRDDLRVMTGQ